MAEATTTLPLLTLVGVLVLFWTTTPQVERRLASHRIHPSTTKGSTKWRGLSVSVAKNATLDRLQKLRVSSG